MPIFTAELSWLTPTIIRQTVEADSPEAAITTIDAMLAADEISFDAADAAIDACTDTEITGLWAGHVTYSGADLRPADLVAATERKIAAQVAPSAVAADPLRDAAPDMLAALKAVQSVNRKGITGPEARKAWLAVNAAIAKAEGES